MESEEGFVVCMRVDGPPGRYVVPGSVIRLCGRCGAEVFVAPSSVGILETRGFKIACMECVSAEELDAGKVEMPMDRAKQELAEGRARGPRDEEEAKAWFRRAKIWERKCS